MKIRWVLPFTTLFIFSFCAQAGECISCQEHRNGGSISYGNNYAPGGIYQSGGRYYPGGVYPGYGGAAYNRYNNGYNNYGSGSISQTCAARTINGDRNLSGGGCVTRYRGPASDIQYLPRINRQIRQTYPSYYNNPWNRPTAVPLK